MGLVFIDINFKDKPPPVEEVATLIENITGLSVSVDEDTNVSLDLYPDDKVGLAYSENRVSIDYVMGMLPVLSELLVNAYKNFGGIDDLEKEHKILGEYWRQISIEELNKIHIKNRRKYWISVAPIAGVYIGVALLFSYFIFNLIGYLL